VSYSSNLSCYRYNSQETLAGRQLPSRLWARQSCLVTPDDKSVLKSRRDAGLECKHVAVSLLTHDPLVIWGCLEGFANATFEDATFAFENHLVSVLQLV
jgi:hypothetical protein